MSGPQRPQRPTRNPTSRPRRVAGQPRTEPTAPVEGPEGEPVAEPVELVKQPPPVAPVVPAPHGTAERAADDTPGDAARDPGRSGRLTIALAVAIALLVALATVEVLYLTSDDGGARSGALTAERPVQLSDLTVRSVVDQAAIAADTILSASSAEFDAEVEAATATMTDPFAVEFRETKAQIKDQFVAEQTTVTVDVSAQGVVSANDDEVVALLFLTLTTQKGTQGGVTPVQYRVTVTMVDTVDGWLVSALDAL